MLFTVKLRDMLFKKAHFSLKTISQMYQMNDATSCEHTIEYRIHMLICYF